MKENYPICAEKDPRAPWNEKAVPSKMFKITVEQLMRKNGVKVETTKYTPQVVIKDEGIVEPEDTGNVNWEEEYKDQHYTILELLAILENMARMELKNTFPNSLRGRELKNIIEECQGWELDDSTYEEA